MMWWKGECDEQLNRPKQNYQAVHNNKCCISKIIRFCNVAKGKHLFNTIAHQSHLKNGTQNIT